MSLATSTYHTFVARNEGYISADVQDRLRSLRILIAGCGIGSSFAELIVRMGAENITLVDGDLVSDTNLNRQFYNAGDVGKSKSQSLFSRLRDINPNINACGMNEYLNEENISEI